jgi:Prokaryotic phospholipase A2
MMKRWTRPILAILLGVFAVGYIGIVPAQAANRDAESETVITYRGYTLRWSEPDASDLRVVRTPGRSESLPDAAIKRSIQQAKSRVASAEQQLSEDPNDSCNFVPDSFGAAMFGPACQAHDACYGPDSNVDRLACDVTFLKSLTDACQVYSTQPALRLTCVTIASIYFIGVRLFGANSYQGTGSDA